jgi:hypothetical protein
LEAQHEVMLKFRLLWNSFITIFNVEYIHQHDMNYYFYLWITDFEYYFHSKNYEKILLIFINCICLATWLLRQWGFKCAKIAYTFDWFKRLLQWISEQSKFEHYFMLCFQFIIIFISNTYIRYTLRSILKHIFRNK